MSTNKRQTQTLQLWPSGRSVEYYGDSADGEYNEAGKFAARHPRRRALAYRTNDPGPLQWHAGTPAEWREVRIAERAQRYQQHEIYHCDSSLVEELLALSGTDRSEIARAFDCDQIENLYTDPSDWDADQCREYIEDQGLEAPDVPDLGPVTCPVCKGTGGRAVVKCTRCGGAGEVPTPDPDADDDDSRGGYLTELRQVCTDHAQDNPAEVYEWYRVSPWLCARLREIGEVVIDNAYGEWWGRTCTGQNNLMDGTLQRIARGQDQDQADYSSSSSKEADDAQG